jgi:hypothetical protein
VAQAQAPRVFVSINGSDANPCSAVQPCRSFNQALTAVETGGEVVVQNSGGYSTGFTISHSVTIDAAGFNASVISTSATDLCTINAGPSDRVVLRGISFHGASVGTNAINATQVGSLYVEHCSIAEFTAAGVNMPNGGNLFVTGTDVRKCANGIQVESGGGTAGNLVAHDSRFAECGFGVFLDVTGAAAVTGWLSDCTASLCTTGFRAESDNTANADLTLTHCRAFGNGTGLVTNTTAAGHSFVFIAHCVVTKNTVSLQMLTGPGGIAAVFGTAPGTNSILFNGTNNLPFTTEALT